MTARPNFVFLLSDDHASNAISCYGSTITATPGIDGIAAAGVRFDTALVENALCTPSRAAFLTGTYSHVSAVTTLSTPLTDDQPTFITELHAAGYRTAIFGKWHLGHGEGYDPAGFDHWEVLPDQGEYFDPEFYTPDGPVRYEGYVTDIITERALAWMADQGDEPYCILIWHKAPHRSWFPHPKYADAFTDPIPLPDTFFDDYEGRGTPAHFAAMRVADHLTSFDLKQDPPASSATATWPCGSTSATCRTTCAASPRSTTGWPPSSTPSAPVGSGRRRSRSTPRTRASTWVSTAGSTSGSCTRSRCGCRWC